MNLNNLVNWEFKDLEEFLRNASNQEGFEVDYKSELPHKNDDKGKIGFRDCFSSFANSKNGGYIFLGIEDKTYRILGLIRDNDLQTKLDKIVQQIRPYSIKWNIINAIEIPSKKNHWVYLIYVKESPYYEKPHISNGKVHIRTNGQSQAIDDGRTLRNLLEIDRFSPRQIDILKFELEKLKTPILTPINNIYLQGLQLYLKGRYSNLLKVYNNLIKSIQNTKIFGEEELTVFSNDNSFDDLLNDFIQKYKEAHEIV